MPSPYTNHPISYKHLTYTLRVGCYHITAQITPLAENLRKNLIQNSVTNVYISLQYSQPTYMYLR